MAVVTTVDRCVPIELPRFRRLLSVELGTSIEYQPEAPQEPGRTWVHLTCAPIGIVMHLEDGITRKSMLRVLEVEPNESADRTRLVALAVAEFVVASWVELRVVTQPALPAAGVPAAPATSDIAARTVQRRLMQVERERPRPAPVAAWHVSIGAGIDTFSSHAGLLPTLSLRLGQLAWPPLSFMIGGDLGLLSVPLVRRRDRIGTIDALRATALGALLVGADFGRTTIAAGPGARFGLVRMSSSSRVPELRPVALVEPHAGVMLLARVSHRIAPPFSFGFELEAGLVTLPVKGTVAPRLRGDAEQAVLEFSGGWLAAGARAALTF